MTLMKKIIAWIKWVLLPEKIRYIIDRHYLDKKHQIIRDYSIKQIKNLGNW